MNAAIASREIGSNGQYVGGVPGGSHVLPAVIPVDFIAEMSVWNGLAVGTSVKSWIASADGTPRSTSVNAAVTAKRRRRLCSQRGQRTSIWIFIR